MELWQVPTLETIVWNVNAPCGAYVQKQGSPGLCLPIIPLADAMGLNPPQSYITDLQQLTLLREHVYWIRIGLADESGEWVSITAELFDESTLIQMARINFVLGQVLPIYGPLSGTAFRTAPGMPYENIWIDLFDYF